jgi:hypothetical protein
LIEHAPLAFDLVTGVAPLSTGCCASIRVEENIKARSSEAKERIEIDFAQKE